MNESAEFSLAGIVATVLRSRRLVMVCTAIGLLAALAAALLRDRIYTTTFSFVPQAAQDPSRSGLASLAGQFGVSLGAAGGITQSSQLYADLLHTRDVLVPIATGSFAPAPGAPMVPLPQVLRIKAPTKPLLLHKTLRALRTKVISAAVATRTTGVVTVTVRTPAPGVSLAVAEQLLHGVNEFNLVTRQSQAKEERQFTEARLREARASLRNAEDALQYFLQTNRQLANAPRLTLERDRLQRDLQLHQSIVTGLAQQYEEIRIREVRDTPVITVIERPVLPVQADPRGRVLLVLSGLLIGMFVGVLAALLRHEFGRRRANPDPAFRALVHEWHRLRGKPA